MPNFNQKGFAPLVMIVIVVAVLAVAGYFAVKTRVAVAPTGSPTATPTPKDETSNWKTYTNAQYGFEIKYPPNWYFAADVINNADGFFISKFTEGPGSQLTILPKGELDAGIDGVPTTRSAVVAGRNVVIKQWDLQDNKSIAHYYFIDPIAGWIKCVDDLKNCNRVVVKADNSADLLVLQKILATFKFDK